jgi:hypothetical protein
MPIRLVEFERTTAACRIRISHRGAREVSRC